MDDLQKGNLNAALVKIRQALEQLNLAAAADPGLELTSQENLLALTAKSVVVNAITQAEAAGGNTQTLQKLEQAKAVVGAGDVLLTAGDQVGAVEKYRSALPKL